MKHEVLGALTAYRRQYRRLNYPVFRTLPYEFPGARQPFKRLVSSLFLL